MHMERLARVAQYLGIDTDERMTLNLGDSGFEGAEFRGLTPDEFDSLVACMVEMDPYSVGELDVETPGSVLTGERAITLRYGDASAE